MFKGGYPDIEIDPRGESKGMTARKHVDLNMAHLEPTVDPKAPAMHLRTPVIASESFLERREDCPPYEACHPNCETQRRNLAECVCMKMTCGQGGHDYIRIKGKYVSYDAESGGRGVRTKHFGRMPVVRQIKHSRRSAISIQGLPRYSTFISTQTTSKTRASQGRLIQGFGSTTST